MMSLSCPRSVSGAAGEVEVEGEEREGEEDVEDEDGVARRKP